MSTCGRNFKIRLWDNPAVYNLRECPASVSLREKIDILYTALLYTIIQLFILELSHICPTSTSSCPTRQETV